MKIIYIYSGIKTNLQMEFPLVQKVFYLPRLNGWVHVCALEYGVFKCNYYFILNFIFYFSDHVNGMHTLLGLYLLKLINK